jgi:RNase P subunit RPR2
MGKANDGVKGPSEAATRINYLYQAAIVIAKKKKKSSKAKEFSRRVLSTHLSHLMVCIGRKSVTRSSREMKRTVCKGCHILLRTGEGASVRTSEERGNKKMRVTCGQCGTKKRFPIMSSSAKTIKKSKKVGKKLKEAKKEV